MNPLEQSVTVIPGVGARRAAQFAKLGLVCIGDFLSHFPRDYEDRTAFTTIFSAQDGQRACIRATVASSPVTSAIRQNLSVTRFKVFDDTGAATVVFFNNPYVKQRLSLGQEYVFFGQVQCKGPLKSLQNPVFEGAGGQGLTGRIVPVYPLTQGLSQKQVADGVAFAMKLSRGLWRELLPPEIIRDHSLCSQEDAFEKIHFPESWDDVGAARRRLIFEELFIYSCASRMLKGKSARQKGADIKPADISPFYSALGFELTGAQKRAVDEVSRDMTSGKRMNRLLQGDVGSGKTAVCAAAAYLAAKSGMQAAVMAPTEILASQHFQGLSPLFESLGLRCGLLHSSMPAAKKREAVRAVENGEIDVLFGTHALIQQDISFKKAGLFVVDEQHRFGVRQRAALQNKDSAAHLLVMSATPIPRTLTLILYGDLDVSVLDELPPGRQQVKTFADSEARRQRILAFLQKEVESGGQAYIVCPLIDDPEGKSEKTAATEYRDRLSNSLPGLRIGLVHGKLRLPEKDRVMGAFLAGEIDVLVSTTVIEVGVNVPNATLMIVENAELFGLSQLHQLRGRVGRGTRQSYCILMSDDSGEASKQRLKTMCQTTDGFIIAEEDLRLRGPGDFLGHRQHGVPEFKIADLAKDSGILQEAAGAAAAFTQDGPGLSKYPLLQGRINEILSLTDKGMLN